MKRKPTNRPFMISEFIWQINPVDVQYYPLTIWYCAWICFNLLTYFIAGSKDTDLANTTQLTNISNVHDLSPPSHYSSNQWPDCPPSQIPRNHRSIFPFGPPWFLRISLSISVPEAHRGPIFGYPAENMGFVQKMEIGRSWAGVWNAHYFVCLHRGMGKGSSDR